MQKTRISHAVRWVREGIKQQCSLAAALLLRQKSFSLLGVPSGLEEVEEGRRVLMMPEHVELAPPRIEEREVDSRFVAALSGVQVAEQGVVLVEGAMATALGGTLNAAGRLVTT